MTAIFASLIVFAIFWALAYITKRRFGVLGLSLAAGALLSALWSGELLSIIEKSNITIASVAAAGLVAAGLVLAPAILLLFSGPSYQKKHSRVVGATLFALFATVLIVEPLSRILVLDNVSLSVFTFLTQQRPIIVTVGVLIALADILAIHTIGGGHHSGKGKH